jgi:Zn-dependent protease
MSSEGPPKAKVVDLRRWKEERDRRLRASGNPPEDPQQAPGSPRIAGTEPFRLHPLPFFFAVSVLLFLPGIGIGGTSGWGPALFWIVGYLHIGLHELGHFLAVCRVGYAPRLLVVGPLTVRWEEGRRILGATREWRWLFGGHVWFDALPSRPRTRARDLAVLLAGPLANLLTLGAVLIVDRFLSPSRLFGLYVRANLLCAALVLLANLLPLPRTPEGYATDGRQILELLRGRRIA